MSDPHVTEDELLNLERLALSGSVVPWRSMIEGRDHTTVRVPRTRRSRSEGARHRCHQLIHEYRRCRLTRHDVVFGTHTVQ